jgi:hypothetical protein
MNFDDTFEGDREGELENLFDIVNEFSAKATTALGEIIADATGEDGIFIKGKLPEDPAAFIFDLDDFLNRWNWKIIWATRKIHENRI